MEEALAKDRKRIEAYEAAGREKRRQAETKAGSDSANSAAQHRKASMNDDKENQ